MPTRDRELLAWSFDPPAISDQVIVVPSRGPTVGAYSLDNGKRLWTFEADDTETGWLHDQPAVTGDTAYLAGWGKRVYALDLTSGQLRWKFQVERGLTCAPVLAGDKILLGVKDYRPSNNSLKAAGDGETAKARELVAYHERRGLVRKHADRCHQLRPSVSW